MKREYAAELENILSMHEYMEECRDRMIAEMNTKHKETFLELEGMYLDIIISAHKRAQKAHEMMTIESHPYLSLALTRRNSAIAEFMQAAGIEAKGDAAQQLREVTHKITFGQLKIVKTKD